MAVSESGMGHLVGSIDLITKGLRLKLIACPGHSSCAVGSIDLITKGLRHEMGLRLEINVEVGSIDLITKGLRLLSLKGPLQNNSSWQH